MSVFCHHFCCYQYMPSLEEVLCCRRPINRVISGRFYSEAEGNHFLTYLRSQAIQGTVNVTKTSLNCSQKGIGPKCGIWCNELKHLVQFNQCYFYMKSLLDNGQILLLLEFRCSVDCPNTEISLWCFFFSLPFVILVKKFCNLSSRRQSLNPILMSPPWVFDPYKSLWIGSIQT